MGTAEHVTEGRIVAEYKPMVEKMFSGAATAKGALIITPKRLLSRPRELTAKRNCKR